MCAAKFKKSTKFASVDRIVLQIRDSLEYIVITLIYITLTTLTNSWGIATTLALFLSTLIVVGGNNIFKKIEQNTRYLMISKFMYTGKGLSVRYVKLLTKIIKIFVLIFVLTLGYVLVYPTTYSRIPPTPLLIVLGVLGTGTFITYFLPKILITIWVSQRRTDAEVELPYVLVFLRTLAPLRLPVYELLEMIEESVSLKTFAKEVKLAKKISSATSTSFLTALDMLTVNHPSEKMREIFRRIILVAISMGDIKDVVEKVFEEVYMWFESRVSSLVEKFTIIVGTALFAYFFIPIIVAAIAPLIGATASPILISILSIQLLIFFVLYALITSFYPTSLVIKSSRLLLVVGGTFMASSVVLAIVNVFLSVLGASPSDRITLTMLVILLGVPIVFVEKEIQRAKFYDRFVQMTSDTLSLVAVTGENPAKTLLENSKRYGNRMRRFVTVIVSGYTSPTLRQAFIVKAPSLYHSAFIETLATVLRLGSKPDALRTFATSYEKLNVVVRNARGFANTLEAVMIGLSAIAGGFLAYLDKIHKYMWSLMISTGIVGGVTAVYVYAPNVYVVIDTLTVLSMLLTSMFVGKVRGGSILYSFRTAFTMIILYTMSKYIALNVAP